MWGGAGSGLVCPLCGRRVVSDEIEFEVEFGPPDRAAASSDGENGSSADGHTRSAQPMPLGDSQVHHFHLRGFEAWHLERETADCGASHNGDGGRAETPARAPDDPSSHGPRGCE
jgi:hypothetical protein